MMTGNLINGGVSVERGRMSRPKYIKALETANRALNSENRRLVRMMQDIISVPRKRMRIPQDGLMRTFTIYINTERK